ncbi:MAG TPA: cobaltochelatase subunit CobN [Prochlorococcus sp.]
MHRLASLPGDGPLEDVLLVEQPSAPILLLTSARTDIATLASVLDLQEQHGWKNRIRALPLTALDHPAQVDHYLATTASKAKLIVVRLLGGRGHWSYGLEQLSLWKEGDAQRELLILAGTIDQDLELHALGSYPIPLADRLALLMREGGVENMLMLLDVFDDLFNDKPLTLDHIKVKAMADPAPWDWQSESGPKVGVVLYRALFQAGDLAFPKAINQKLRDRGLVPRAIWVSSLRDPAVQKGVAHLFKQQNVEAVLTTTSFASVQFEQVGLGSVLWDELDVPVLQVLSSGRPRQEWIDSSRGLDPLDLSLQVVLPELDGRITTRPGAFRSIQQTHDSLSTVVQGMEPDDGGLNWTADHLKNWIKLRQAQPSQRRIALVLANYPIRDGRIANGVGLDTPASTASILKWLQESGHELGSDAIPADGQELMKCLLSSRTNDPESQNRPALSYLSLSQYLSWWDSLPSNSVEPILKRWGSPEQAIDLEADGFPIHGISFKNVVVLIQPSRGYDSDEISDLHSPDLPPPHRYLAQYLWISQVHRSNLLVHIGKHGSVEWLPGKGVGLSDSCYPNLALGPLPNVYPFIVNDPGEGSQAKRRSQAVIIDHLTPPLGRAGLHGDLLKIEVLLDEYVEANQLGAERVYIIESKLINLLEKNNWPGLPKVLDESKESRRLLQKSFDNAETYLCELKESQIRTGLHHFGKAPTHKAALELLLAIARAPSNDQPGLTQSVATKIGLELDPWSDEEGEIISSHDKNILIKFGLEPPRRIGDAVAWIEEQTLILLDILLVQSNEQDTNINHKLLIEPLRNWLNSSNYDPHLKLIKQDLWPRLMACAEKEHDAFINAVSGRRITSGPSGAPTRGKPEVLPTGRNFYSVDLRGLPTEAAWDLGKRSAEQLLDLHLLEQGEHLTHLALSVWGTATMRNGGEDIAQLLALIGVRPVWDGPSRRMVGLDVIPISLLGRPRVDVILRISGLFRDAFPQLVGWVNKAQILVSNLKEDAKLNPLAEITRQKGPQGRVYGSAPGAYGAGLQALIDSGSWNNRADLGESYLAWSQWRYSGESDPTLDRDGLERGLQNVQVVLHNQDNREHDLLDSDDYYQFHGGLAAAVELTSGQRPDLWFGDHSRRDRPRMRPLEQEIDKVVRSRLLNPRWIDGMKQHGYKGAFEMGASLDYLFAYDAATDLVPDWCYKALYEHWLENKAVQDFLSDKNPWVLRDMAERLLEAANRGMWNSADQRELISLREIVNTSEAKIETNQLN